MSEQTKHILWITPKFPLPAEDGARIATVNLLRGLKDKDLKIDLLSIVTLPIDTKLVEELVTLAGLNKIFTLFREKPPQNKLSKGIYLFSSIIRYPYIPITMAPYYKKSLKESILSITKNNKYDFVLYDGLHTGIHGADCFLNFNKLSISSTPYIYRAHNRESVIWSRKTSEEKNPVKRALLYIQKILVKRFEDKFSKESFFTATVSDEDADLFKQAVPSIKVVTIPIGYDFSKKCEFPTEDKLNLLFVGTLDWLPNKDGLIWFLKDIWPDLIKKNNNISLTIIGGGDSSWLKGYKALPNLRVLGRVPKLDEFYKNAHASILPIHYGSGTRVKGIEASKYCRPCISTSIGVEGLGLKEKESYLRAETKEEWIDLISNLTLEECKKVGLSAYDQCKEKFSINSAGENLYKRLQIINKIS